ncbi:MAG: 2OG-Fe(II) oxygenase family protein [Rhodocyclaceae bacterium]
MAHRRLSLRFVCYPAQRDAPAAGQMRYGAHHDYGGLTILRQDAPPGGLQIADRDGSWHDVPPQPDSFVINVGDLMSRWTGGRWRSTLHRVVNPPAAQADLRRLSMVAFTGPNDDAVVSCLPGFRPVDGQLLAPVVAGDYILGTLALPRWTWGAPHGWLIGRQGAWPIRKEVWHEHARQSDRRSQ